MIEMEHRDDPWIADSLMKWQSVPRRCGDFTELQFHNWMHNGLRAKSGQRALLKFVQIAGRNYLRRSWVEDFLTTVAGTDVRFGKRPIFTAATAAPPPPAPPGWGQAPATVSMLPPPPFSIRAQA